MLHAYLFRLLSANFAGHMLESFAGRGTIVVDLLHGYVRLRGQTQILGLGIDDDQHGVGTVTADQLVDGDVVLVELGPCVIPAHNTFPGVHLLEHAVHVLQVVVVQEPHRLVLVVLVEGNCLKEEHHLVCRACF